MLNNKFEKTSLWFCIMSFICVSLFLTADTSFAAGENKEVATEPVKSRIAHPHCGLYCMYAVLKLSGREIDFRELVKPEYLGSKKGSSLAGVIKGVRHQWHCHVFP